MSSVKIIDKTPLIIAKVQRNSASAIRQALGDVLRESRPKTPKADTNFLRNNTRIQVTGSKGKVAWLAGYAQYQERGARRDGSHKVRNYTTGGTGKAFALNAVKKVTEQRQKYLKGLLK